MKKLLILSSVLLMVLVAGLVYAFTKKPAPVDTTTSPVSFPQSTPSNSITTGSANVRIQIEGSTKNTISVLDFMHNKETVQDTVNDGDYFLAGSVGYCLVDGTCPAGAVSDEYTISYESKGSLFTVVLLKEPLKNARVHAEAFLISRLGISQNDLCSLKYQVLVASAANDMYADYANVGFSTCTDSIQLP